MPGGRYTKGGRYPRGVGIPNRPVLTSSGDHKWEVSILLESNCLKFSTFIVFFDFLSTILVPYLCRHIYFYCLYNSTV